MLVDIMSWNNKYTCISRQSTNEDFSFQCFSATALVNCGNKMKISSKLVQKNIDVSKDSVCFSCMETRAFYLHCHGIAIQFSEDAFHAFYGYMRVLSTPSLDNKILTNRKYFWYHPHFVIHIYNALLIVTFF